MANLDEDMLVNEGAIPPDDFHDNIERIREVAAFDLEVPNDLSSRLSSSSSGLLIDPDTLLAASAALQSGHLILQGPPGTGKSSLARALCSAFNASVLPVTAHEDWTVFEVIGRLELKLGNERTEEIQPVNGFFTEAAIRCAGNVVKHFDDATEPQAEWLLIDELNRSYFDKAFGELFTVIGTDEPLPITLPHQRINNRELVIPRRFRIIGTINSLDRQFVNNLSQAIRRRFTFVTVDIPSKRSAGEEWSLEPAESASLAIREFQVVVNRAIDRIARRVTSLEPSQLEATKTTLRQKCNSEWLESIKSLFNLIEGVRYVSDGEDYPHIPVGTAQLIDTVELFLNRVVMEPADMSNSPKMMDWACSVKIVPLFEGGSVTPDLIRKLADDQAGLFSGVTKRELLKIVAAGMHYVV